MINALLLRDVEPIAAQFIADDFLHAEMEGKSSHGIGRFVVIDRHIHPDAVEPEVVTDAAAVSVIDGHRTLGQIVAKRAALEAIRKAKKYGIGVCAARNFSRFSSLKPYPTLIAESGMLGLALSAGGAPPLMFAPGASKPTLGTNPIAFAFPRDPDNVSADFATSEHAWGHVRQAVLQNTDLPPGFLNDEGRSTTDPSAAFGVRSFGGGKGFALAYAIEVIAGTLAGAKMGDAQQSALDLGLVLIAFNPETFGVDSAGLRQRINQLTLSIRQDEAGEHLGPPHTPGDESMRRRHEAEDRASIKVPEPVVRRLIQMTKVAPLGDDLPNRSRKR